MYHTSSNIVDQAQLLSIWRNYLVYEGIKEIIPLSYLRYNEPMKAHTTFQIGGPVDVMALPTDSEQVGRLVAWCRAQGIPYLIMGQGSNLLVRDKGIRGVVIKLEQNFAAVKVEGEVITAQAGVRLAELAEQAVGFRLSGLEFAQGIPGSLGGTIYMNAGAYGGEMKDVVDEVEAISEKGLLHTFSREELDFGYRQSVFHTNGHIVLVARIRLKRGEPGAIKARMEEFARRREEKQPLEYPSAGSVFRRPAGHYVGPMVEEMGLKGHRIGGAEVSRKHAGFIINTGGATAADVLALISLIRARAQERYGIVLQPEIRIVGEK